MHSNQIYRDALQLPIKNTKGQKIKEHCVHIHQMVDKKAHLPKNNLLTHEAKMIDNVQYTCATTGKETGVLVRILEHILPSSSAWGGSKNPNVCDKPMFTLLVSSKNHMK